MKNEFGFGIIAQEEILLINGGVGGTSAYGVLKREIAPFINGSSPLESGKSKSFTLSNLTPRQQLKLITKVHNSGDYKHKMDFSTDILTITHK